MSLRRIIKDRHILEDNRQHLSDDTPLPPTGPFTVSLARWTQERGSIPHDRLTDVGVRIPNDVNVNEITDLLKNLKCIAVNFPASGDGRAFSQARVLREQHGYLGEIRAMGDVLRDQVWHMARCGIDTFEPRPDRSIEDVLKAFQEMSVTYQPATDTDESIFLRRRKAS